MPIAETLSGISMAVNDVQCEKANSPIETNVLGKVNETTLSQEEKA